MAGIYKSKINGIKSACNVHYGTMSVQEKIKNHIL